jgi:hypothetical protein
MLIEQQLAAPRAGARECGTHPGRAEWKPLWRLCSTLGQHEDLANGDACPRPVRQLLFLS